MATLSGGKGIEKALAAIGRKMSGSVKVGFMNGATYPVAQGGESVAQVAFWNEFGTTRIPSRPFFRTMISRESPGWGVLISKAAVHYDYNGSAVLGFMGEKIIEQLQRSITEWQDPPNAQSTIDAKGFNKPLVDTNHMHNSITLEVGE